MTWKLAKTLCRDNFEALSLSNIPFWLTHFSGPQSRKITRPCRHLRNSTARREARETENKSLNRKKQRGISWNFTFTALADELLVSLFLKAWNTRKVKTTEERSPHHPRLLFASEKYMERDGFVLMSGNENEINYSKVKFVWFSFVFFASLVPAASASFLLIPFRLFSKQSHKFVCWNFNGIEAHNGECTAMNPRVRLCIFRRSLKLIQSLMRCFVAFSWAFDSTTRNIE